MDEWFTDDAKRTYGVLFSSFWLSANPDQLEVERNGEAVLQVLKYVLEELMLPEEES